MIGHCFDLDNFDVVLGADLADYGGESLIDWSWVSGQWWVVGIGVGAGDDSAPVFGAPHHVVVAAVSDVVVGANPVNTSHDLEYTR